MPRPIQVDLKALSITSPAFKPGGSIPSRYTCEGEDVSPPLVIRNIPSEAKSLVLIVEDPDAPRGTWLHWLVWNIPVVGQIHENEIPGEQGMNDFGRIDYGGPCPPSGTHRYYFNVYALNTLLDLPEGCSQDKVRKAMEAHVIAHGELVGLYRKTG